MCAGLQLETGPERPAVSSNHTVRSAELDETGVVDEAEHPELTFRFGFGLMTLPNPRRYPVSCSLSLPGPHW